MESKYLLERRERMLGIKTPAEKKTFKSIPKKSTKNKVDIRAYNKIKKEMLSENDRCELNTPDCIHQATGLHHMKRRGSNLLNKKYLLRSCDPCNSYVEKHPQYALDNGLSISVHKV